MNHCHDFHGNDYPAGSLALLIFRLHRIRSSTLSPASSNRGEQRGWTYPVSRPGSMLLPPPLNPPQQVCSHVHPGSPHPVQDPGTPK